MLYVTRNMTHSFLSFRAQIFLSHFSFDWGQIQTKKLIAGEAYMQVKTTQSLYNENSFPVQHPND